MWATIANPIFQKDRKIKEENQKLFYAHFGRIFGIIHLSIIFSSFG